MSTQKVVNLRVVASCVALVLTLIVLRRNIESMPGSAYPDDGRPYFHLGRSTPTWKSGEKRDVPVLVDEVEYFPNMSGGETTAELAFYPNQMKIRDALSIDPIFLLPVLRTRFADPATPPTLRLFYAGMLACHLDRAGTDYLIRSIRERRSPEDMRDPCWIIGHLEWFPPHERDDALVDRRWAVDLIVELLQMPLVTSPRSSLPLVADEMNIAQGDGRFMNVLADTRSERAFDVLSGLLGGGERPNFDVSDVYSALQELGDRRAIPIFLGRVREESWSSEGSRAISASWRALSEFGCVEAVDPMLERLECSWVYEGFRRFDDPAVRAKILARVRAALPELRKNDRDGYAISQARWLIVDLEGGDSLPKLMDLVRDPGFRARDGIIESIKMMKDERAIPLGEELLRSAPDYFDRVWATRLLATYDGPRILKDFVDALSFDFRHLENAGHKGEDSDAQLKSEIAITLKEKTGQDFGPDPVRWAEWLARNAQGTR